MPVLTTPGLAESIRKNWGIAVLAYVDHPDGEVFAWSGVGSLKYAGKTYQGVGRFGRISGVGGAKRLAVRQLTFELSGVPVEAARWLNKDVRGRSAKAWIAGLKPNGRVNGEPWLHVDGACDYHELEPERGQAVVKLMIHEPVWSIERAQNLAFTPQWIKSVHGADVGGCDDIPGMRNRVEIWTQS